MDLHSATRVVMWNVQTLCWSGKLGNAIWEMEHCKIGVLGNVEAGQTMDIAYQPRVNLDCFLVEAHTVQVWFCQSSQTKSSFSSPPLSPIPSAGQHQSYGDCLEVKTEYYQNCSVLDCVTQFAVISTLYEQFLQVQQIGFVTLGPLCCA